MTPPPAPRTAQSNPDFAPLPWPPELLGRIQRLLEKHTDQGLFRELCQLALDSQEPAERFYRLLKEAKMHLSRASEIKAVLEDEERCRLFRKGKLTWKETLDLVRHKPTKPERAARRLLGLLQRIGPDWPQGQVHKRWSLERNPIIPFRMKGPAGTLEILKVISVPLPTEH